VSDQNRRVYNFNSVGETVEDREKRVLESPSRDVPIGIKTPIELSNDNSTLFKMHTSQIKQIRDNFRNMLATNHGDRMMLYDFGANLTPLAFELGASGVDGEALKRISATTRKYMPFINLQTFEPVRQFSDDGSLARVGVRVSFTVPLISPEEQMVEAIIMAAA
tara:strand:+ start:57 stop:548 length:492 start_codon:yes stop_codon:yes gene_type:complete